MHPEVTNITENQSDRASSGLARKLLIRILSVIVVVSALVAALQGWQAYKLADRSRDNSIRYTITNFNPILLNSLWQFELDEVKTIGEAFMRNTYISGVMIRDENGSTLVRLGDVPDEAGGGSLLPDMLQVDDIEMTGTVRRYGYALIYRNVKVSRPIGDVTLYADTGLVYRNLQPVLITIVVTLLLLLVSLSVVFYLVQRRVVAQPIMWLTQAVQALDPHKLIGEVEPEVQQRLNHRKDELGDLYRSYSEMRERLILRDQQLQEYQTNLEQTVAERTSELEAANTELQSSMEKLKIAQDELVESEKMASLGGLVSGVAHEVNTPLGIGITAASHLEEELKQTNAIFDRGELKKQDFVAFLSDCGDTSRILLSNLQRAADLVRSFKQVAVDQSSEDKRELEIVSYIEDILRSLNPKLKKTQVSVTTDFCESMVVETFPGALAQVLTNLIMNALTHAYADGTQPGILTIRLAPQPNMVKLEIEDDGVGMNSATRRRIFEPFYTTRRGTGGSGLGLNIVYNLVNQKLGGRITCSSEPGQGTRFTILMPLQAPDLPEGVEDAR